MMYEIPVEQMIDYARLQEAERALMQYVAWIERDAVGGGVLCGDVPSHYIRGWFDWPELPNRLVDADPPPDEWR